MHIAVKLFFFFSRSLRMLNPQDLKIFCRLFRPGISDFLPLDRVQCWANATCLWRDRAWRNPVRCQHSDLDKTAEGIQLKCHKNNQPNCTRGKPHVNMWCPSAHLGAVTVRANFATSHELGGDRRCNYAFKRTGLTGVILSARAWRELCCCRHSRWSRVDDD